MTRYPPRRGERLANTAFRCVSTPVDIPPNVFYVKGQISTQPIPNTPMLILHRMKGRTVAGVMVAVVRLNRQGLADY